jgi:general secretion pathway protein E
VSTIPVGQGAGERIVMRILNKTSVMLELTDLGFAPDRLGLMHDLINRPEGIILVTGPTGSARRRRSTRASTSINSPDRNILTAEDPIEYDIGGLSQMQVNPKIGLTFASCLRAFLRQDPDVIMVGEIRDKETAEIAVHASLTGHLVLSTIHTNDAAGAVTRLVEMGIEPFLVTLVAHRHPRAAPRARALRLQGAVQELRATARPRASARKARRPSRRGTRPRARLPVRRPGDVPEPPDFHKPGGCEACGTTRASSAAAASTSSS